MTLNTSEQYGSDFQIKVISSLLLNKEFLLNIRELLSEEYFGSNAHRWIVNSIIKYYDVYHTNPTMEVLKTEIKKLDNEVLQISIKEQLKLAYSNNRDDSTYIEEEFNNFCKNQKLKNALIESVDLLQIGEYDSIRNIIDNALKSGMDKNTGHEYNKDVETRYRFNDRKEIPTPWETVNELLQGGLGKGDLGLIFGNPGGGKTHTLIDIGAFAVNLGYNVIHYTLELSEDYVGRRYDARLTEIPVNDILNRKNEVQQTVDKLKGNLIIKEYAPKRASLQTLENHINKCSDLGFKADMIIIDYLDLLSAKKAKEKKDEIDDIYIGAKGLAKTLKIPVWSVSQLNRSGAGLDIIEGTSVAGSYDKIMISDFCMSLSRKKEDKVNGTGRFHIMKNRYGPDGDTYNALVDTNISKISFLEKYDEEETNIVEQRLYKKQFNEKEKEYLSNRFFELSNSDIEVLNK